jgi:hypothetical protein
LSSPEILPWALEPHDIVKGAVLRALVINDASDLDWAKWKAAIEERELAGLGIS